MWITWLTPKIWAALLGQFEKRAVAAGVEFKAHHVTAYMVSQSIVEEAEALGCDMIVMVTEGRSRLGKFIFGSHTKNVIIESTLPVLVLRRGCFHSIPITLKIEEKASTP